jgi:hypothetical protein
MDYDPKYVYRTLTSSLGSSDEPEWAITEDSEKVRIPVFAYRTGKEPESGLFGYGMQMGMQALHINEHPYDCVVLVLGVERHDLSDEEDEDITDAYRVYVGISFAREK